jgi:stringent starvation protein B
VRLGLTDFDGALTDGSDARVLRGRASLSQIDACTGRSIPVDRQSECQQRRVGHLYHPAMTPNRPYLVRALYEWILDNNMTPHLLVDAQRPATQVPPQFVQDGKIVLNISPGAVRGLVLGNEHISFNARFGGMAMDVSVPVQGVLGIYARENGRGMLFPDDETRTGREGQDAESDEPPKPPRDRPTLKVIK